MTKKSLYIVILMVMGILLFFTNPTYDSHQNKINDQFKKENKVVGFLGGGKAVGALSTYHNYLLFSTTVLDGDLLSIGVLSKVIVLRDLKL